VPVVLAAREQVSERELVDGRRPGTQRRHLGFQWCLQRLRDHQPTQAHARRKGLTHAAGEHNAVRIQRLHRPDRLSVVAELAVVVVLDDEAAAASGPFHHRGSPRGRQHHPVRVLVGRCE
jgi:hypothetical protein